MREILDGLRARKNAPLPTAEVLAAQIGDARAELARMKEERAELSEDVGLLDGPGLARLAEVEALLPHKVRALTSLDEKHGDAVKREEVARLKARSEQFQRETAKAAKTYPARYAAAAQAYATVLEELRTSRTEHHGLAGEGQRLGVPAASPHLEAVIRGEELQRGWKSLTESVVRDIHGRILFEA